MILHEKVANTPTLWGQSLYLPQGKPSDRRNKVQQECNISQTQNLVTLRLFILGSVNIKDTKQESK